LNVIDHHDVHGQQRQEHAEGLSKIMKPSSHHQFSGGHETGGDQQARGQEDGVVQPATHDAE
jgi:hypothetical protein